MKRPASASASPGLHCRNDTLTYRDTTAWVLPGNDQMRVFWQPIAKLSQAETRLFASILTIAALLLAFGLFAGEVIEGETLSFDRKLLLAVHQADNPSVPIGPPWLPEAARDISALGSTIVLGILLLAVVGYLLLTRKASRSVADAGRGIKRRGLEQLAEIQFRAAEARSRGSCRAGLHRKLPERPRHHVSHHLFDIGSPVGPNPFRDPGADLFHDACRDAHGPGRPEPNVSRSSLSDRCAGGLVHRDGLGHGLLGAHDMAATRGTSRAAGKVMTLLRNLTDAPRCKAQGCCAAERICRYDRAPGCWTAARCSCVGIREARNRGLSDIPARFRVVISG